MKACILLALLGSASAQTAADKTDTSQPNYTTLKDPKYNEEQMKAKECKTDADCTDLDVGTAGSKVEGKYHKGACLQHMWKYGAQHESAKGCWDLSLCWNATGHQSYLMFDSRKIQWFCTDEQIALAKPDREDFSSLKKETNGQYRALTADTGPANFWPKYTESCAKNADCTGEN